MSTIPTLPTTDDRRHRRTDPLLNSPIAAMDSPDLPAAPRNRPVRRYKSERPPVLSSHVADHLCYVKRR